MVTQHVHPTALRSAAFRVHFPLFSFVLHGTLGHVTQRRSGHSAPALDLSTSRRTYVRADSSPTCAQLCDTSMSALLHTDLQRG